MMSTRMVPLTQKMMMSFFAFNASDEECADERPATTRSGRAVTRRTETDFSFF